MDKPTQASVVFTPAGVRRPVDVGTSVLDAARAAGVDLDSTCGGRGLCGRCQISPSLGEFAKWGISSVLSSLTPAGPTEIGYRGRRPIADDMRLGCQAVICGDVVVDIPATSQIHRPVVRKAIDLHGLEVDPMIVARMVEIPVPDLGDGRADADLLTGRLEADWGIVDAVVDARVLPGLHRAISQGGQRVTAIVHSDGTVLAVRPGFDDVVYGLAVDVGSTTIAGYLVDLTNGEVVASVGVMNPQIRFGEDLMSRVSYVMMNPGGDTEMTSAVRSCIDSMINDLAGELELSPEDLRSRVHDMVAVGNPIMHHLLLGIDPTPLGAAPFTLAVSAPVDMRADELDIDLPFARAHLGPCIAGHVGADAAAATLDEQTHLADPPQLLVDVGTNAEIVLGTPSTTYAASSPTGPAFEGAQISCGMRATSGAIERIRIDRETKEPRFKVIGSDLWSDEPGFAQSIEKIEVAGLCGSAIIEVIGEMFLAGVCRADGVIDGSLAATTPRVQPHGRTFKYVIRVDDELAITQNDVRQIQLAGAALRAGIDLLMEHAGVSEVHDVRLAGAFGAHIDPVYALVLGLVPDCPVEGVRSVGNSAGAGAVRMLVSASQRAEIAATVRQIEKIETAIEPRFQELFVEAMAFPHQRAPTTHLARVVDLPERTVTKPHRRGRRRSTAKNARDDS